MTSAASVPRQPAALRVLTDTSLVRQVVSFQHGLPLTLFEFWCANDATIFTAAREDQNLIHARHHELLTLVLARGRGGTIQLLDMFQSIRFSDYDHKGFHWTAPSLDSVVREAVASHRVDLLQWVIANNAVAGNTDTSRLWLSALESFEGDNVHVLNLLFAAVPMDHQVVAFVASKIRTVALLHWLGVVMPDAKLPPTMTTLAVQQGDLEMVQYLQEYRAPEGCTADAMTEALGRHHLAILEYLFTHRMDTLDWRHAVSLVEDCDGEFRELLTRFAPAFPPIPANYVRLAIADCDDNLIDALIETGLLSELSLDAEAAAGDLEVVQWLHSKGITTATTDAVDRAASADHWHVALFLLEQRSEGCTVDTMVEAVGTGMLELVRFVYKHMQKASNGSVSGMTEPMDVAAAAGHLAIVQFLHWSGFGCTAYAVDQAIAGEHLDVALYLLTHRSEGCTTAAVRDALTSGYNEIVGVVYRKRPQLFDTELMAELVCHGLTDLSIESLDASLDGASAPEDDLVAAQLREIQDQQVLERLKAWSGGKLTM